MEEPEGWRKELKKGDRVEVIKSEKQLEGWTTGTILEKDGNKFTISADGAAEPVCILPCTTKDIAPLGTYTDGNRWRLKLNKGDLIDCMDTSNCWYLCTILETDYTTPTPKVYVAYRTYREDGKKKDDDGRSFQGWSKSFDEWVDVFSLRVQLPGSLSKEGYIECKSWEKENDKLAIDDSKDILLNSPLGAKLFCVQRQEKESPEFVVNLLNDFGAKGGFEKIFKRLTNKDKPLQFGKIEPNRIELLFSYIEVLGGVWALFHRKFACEYIPKLKNVIVGCLESIHDTEVRKLERESLDKLHINLSNLLRRVYTMLERLKITEQLEIMLCTVMLQSNYLQRQIDGLKGLNEIVKRTGQGSVLTSEYIINWIQQHKIIDELFKTKKHQQILQRSVPIVTFMFDQKLLTTDIMEKMWENVQDDQFKDDILKVIREAAFPIDSPELEFFVLKIAELTPSMMTEEALDVISDARKEGEKSPEKLIKYAGILEKIMLGNDYSLNISEKATEKYAGMILDLPFEPYKKDILNKCIHQMLEKVKFSFNL